MAQKKRESTGGAASGWLNTYAGMVTLLLTFFVLLFSMSSLDAAKFNMLVSSFAGNANPYAKVEIRSASETDPPAGQAKPETRADSEPASLEDLSRQLGEYVDAHQMNNSINISSGEGYVFIRLMDDIPFEPNSAILKPADQEILQYIGSSVKSVQNGCRLIQINGHTAAAPNDPDYAVSDWQLSAARANSVLMYFEDEIGVDPMKLQCVGWGKTKPFVSNNTEEGRSKNRRVEILISSDNPPADRLDSVYRQLAG